MLVGPKDPYSGHSGIKQHKRARIGRQALPIFPSPHFLTRERKDDGPISRGAQRVGWLARLISLAAPITHCEPMDTHPHQTSSSAVLSSTTTTDIPRLYIQDSTKLNYLHKHLAASPPLTKRIHCAILSVGISRRKRPSITSTHSSA